MKIEFEETPSSIDNPNWFYAIRLYPETNQEMALLERAITLQGEPKEYLRNPIADKLHYAIIFGKKEKPKK